MRRMIPENQQEALRKLTSREALLGLMTLSIRGGIDSLNVNIDSDGFNYVNISGQATLVNGAGEFFDVVNIPEGLYSAESYPATNDEGGGGSVNTQIVGSTLTITFNNGTAGRTVYFSILISKFKLIL